MPDKLRFRLWVLAFGQSRELLCADRAFQTPLLGELALPLTVSLLIPTPVVRLLRRELAGMICPCLAAGKRFGDGQRRVRSGGIRKP